MTYVEAPPASGDDLPNGTLLLLNYGTQPSAASQGLGAWGIVLGRIHKQKGGWSYLILGVRRFGRMTPYVASRELRRRSIHLLHVP